MIAANRSAIKVRELTKIYGGKVVVDDVSFSVEEGEILAIVGPNGAGKSTTVEVARTSPIKMHAVLLT